jgi:hypothetical protein
MVIEWDQTKNVKQVDVCKVYYFAFEAAERGWCDGLSWDLGGVQK